MVKLVKLSLDKYTLIITEKPDAASRIAVALDKDGKPKKMFDSGVPFYQAYRSGDIVVVPALGHLSQLQAKKKLTGSTQFLIITGFQDI